MDNTQEIYAEKSSSVSEFTGSSPETEIKEKEEIDKKWARCRNCHYKIALTSDKINVNGIDTHIFENPAGIFYRVICFKNAPGSINLTEYTEDNTWFPGYSWSITICRSCNNHLGWHYSSGSSEFYGLIADRLTGV